MWHPPELALAETTSAWWTSRSITAAATTGPHGCDSDLLLAAVPISTTRQLDRAPAEASSPALRGATDLQRIFLIHAASRVRIGGVTHEPDGGTK
jgi:hypothetical protein